MGFNGPGTHLGNLSLLSPAKSRSISAENMTGEKGRGGMSEDGAAKECARDLGRGWKISPYLDVEPGETKTLAEIAGPGAIQQIWLTVSQTPQWWRFTIIRIYWDDQKIPSVECPVGDFFAAGWGRFNQVSSLAVCVNPANSFNAYWEMPFRKRCRITVENIADNRIQVFYQINYALAEVPENAAYFHAQFRRVNPLKYKEVHTIVDGIAGPGHYVGTYTAWQTNNTGWWGEGEVKFYLDGDDEFPTICGTGTEDYFCGSYCFLDPDTKEYVDYTTPYAGFAVAEKPDGRYRSQTRFSMYRWHIVDPIRFEKDLRVTMQALGWRSGGRYLPLQDDLASVAYWYQQLPTAPFPKLPARDALEVV